MRFSVGFRNVGSYLFTLFGLGMMTSNLLAYNPSSPVVWAKYETEPVRSAEDAADDPSVWVHPENPTLSTIIGTDKKGSVSVYDLKGKKLSSEKVKLNNVDVRYNFGPEKMDVVGGTVKEKKGFMLFKYDSRKNAVVPLHRRPFEAKVNAYGFCFYHSAKTKKLYAFVTGKTGMMDQWEIVNQNGKDVEARFIRQLSIPSQTEGCVADDEYGFVYAAEEQSGVWKFSAEPDQDSRGTLIASVSENSNLIPDLEGLALYSTSEGQGYLLLSVQSKNQFAVFDRTGNNRYLFSFSVGGVHGGQDPVTHTDGIEAISGFFGPDYPFGMFVAQDDENSHMAAGKENQNFKLVSWEDLVAATPLLKKDRAWNPRKTVWRSGF